MKFLSFAFAALIAFTGVASAAHIAGSWEGTWTKDGDALVVTVTFEKAGAAYTGAFDSDSLQMAATPLAAVSETDGNVRWSLPNGHSTTVFDGTIEGDTLTGTFVDGATHGDFALTRAAPPASQIDSHDVIFADGGLTRSGMLLLPRTPGPHSAIVLLHDAGPEGRPASTYLGQAFAGHGIAALVCDQQGDLQKSDVGAQADDALAAVRYLRARRDIDPARIGIYGHGQGGMIAPVVAARDGHLAFVMASAAAGIAPDDVERFSVENSIGWKSLSPVERKDADVYVQALIDVGYRGKPRAKLDALAAKFKRRRWFFAAPPPRDSYWTTSRQLARFQPWIWWRQVNAPVLLVYGGHDERVPPVRSADSIRAALAAGSNPPVRLQFYPDADHLFTIVDPAKTGGWAKKEPDYAAVLTGWAEEQTGMTAKAGR